MSSSKELKIGAALADRYTIIREIGRGGMATVFLARDLKHERDVALKVLHRSLGAVLGTERFLTEIRTTAQLHHPNILPLFDSGEADGMVFYVMPYVEGETVRNRIAKEGQLGVTEAVRITSEVADALAHAHKHGVIHRDIKPENILLQDGHAVVSDFGIAIAVSHAAGTRITQTGFSVGTPQYMSPEQAAADREIDGRSDQYSLASVLYEMLVGEPPFTGPNTGAIMSRMMSEPAPDVTRRRKSVPESVAEAIHRALEKVPGDRFPDVGAFGEALAPTARLTGTHRVTSVAPRSNRAVPLALVGGLLFGLIGGVLLLRGKDEHTVTTGAITHVTTDDGLEVQPAISPDGKMMAYVVGTPGHVRILLRSTEGGRAVPLTRDTTGNQQEPRWSPSGTGILFLAGGGVDTVAVGLGGGTAVTVIAGDGAQVATATWSPDGRQIAYVRRDSMWIYTIATGQSRFLASGAFKECAWSPGGEAIACTSPRNFATVVPSMGNIGPSVLSVTTVGNGTTVAVTDSVSLNVSPAWSPDGRRLYFVSNRDHQRDIYYVTVRRDGHANGAVHRLTTALNAASLSLSRDGRRLAYSVYTPYANIWSLPILSSGVASSFDAAQVTFGHQLVESIWVSPDGRTLIYDADRNGNSDVWRLNIGDGEPEALTSDRLDEFGGVLSPDGKRLAFYSYPVGTGRGVIWVKPLGGGAVQQVNTGDTYGIWPEWSPDGKAIIWGCSPNARTTRWCTGTQDSEGRWQVKASESVRVNWSPDGMWSADRRRIGNGPPADSIWIMPRDSGARRLIYTPARDEQPVAGLQWGADSRTIYFKRVDANGNASFWGIPINGGPPRLVARLDDPKRPSYRSDFATDGRRIYFPVNDRQSDISIVELIEH